MVGLSDHRTAVAWNPDRLSRGGMRRTLSPVNSPLPPLPLVGRARELAALTAAMTRAEGGRAQTVLIAGEGGVGKTRLARLAADEAVRRNFLVAEGRAYSVESGVPYAIFADAMLPMLRRMGDAALAVLTRGATGELSRVFPGLLATSSSDGERGGSAADAKARLYWSVMQLIDRLAARQPVLLVLDNLQWADAASLELLHFVARQTHSATSGSRLLLVGTYVDTERELNPLLRGTVQSLVSLGAAQVERVAPLSHAETAELIERAFGAPAAAIRPFAALLHDWTRGNPFFVEETLKSLVESGRLHEGAGRWQGWGVNALDLPRSVRDAVLERVGRVSAAARTTLELMAVLGTRVRYPVLRAVSSAPDPALLGALDELRNANLIDDPTPDDDSGYDFTHPLVRDSVYAALGRPRAQMLHGCIAGELERFHGARAMRHADELAFHFTRAAAGQPEPKALRYLAEAGRQALSRYASRAAASYLQSALDLLDAAAPDSGDDRSIEPQIVESLARARQQLGERDAAVALWERARGDATARGDVAAVAAIERRMGLLAFAGGQHELALKHYDAGLDAAIAAGDRELETRLRLATANSLQALARRDEARRQVDAALATADTLGNVALLARVHRAMLLLLAWTGPVAEARTHGTRAVALARESGERVVEWSAHWAMAISSGLTGDSAKTAHHLAEAERLAEEVGSPVLRLWTAEVSIEYMAGTGEWASALAVAERTIPAARSLGMQAMLPRLLVWTGLIYRGLGDWERAGSLIDEAWRLAGADRLDDAALDVHAVVPVHTGMAGYLMTTGENQRALDVGEAGLAIADRTGNVAWAVYRLLPFIIETSLYLEDHERAARHNVRLRRDSLALGHALGLAWADTTDALLTYLSGAVNDAVPMLRAAAAALEAVPFVFDAARLRRLVARALIDAGDPDGAAHELREAHEVFVRLGAEREMRAVREQIRALGARPPARVTATGEGALSGREAEIARLVAARKSNKEIATVLDISPRTVSTHLSNIFGKLGVSSRGELTDLVREKGLSD